MEPLVPAGPGEMGLGESISHLMGREGSFDEKIDAARFHKETGNALLNSGDYEDALRKYVAYRRGLASNGKRLRRNKHVVALSPLIAALPARSRDRLPARSKPTTPPLSSGSAASPAAPASALASSSGCSALKSTSYTRTSACTAVAAESRRSARPTTHLPPRVPRLGGPPATGASRGQAPSSAPHRATGGAEHPPTSGPA